MLSCGVCYEYGQSYFKLSAAIRFVMVTRVCEVHKYIKPKPVSNKIIGAKLSEIKRDAIITILHMLETIWYKYYREICTCI